MRALLYLIVERTRIIICDVFYGGHNFVGVDIDEVDGCTRCFQFKNSKIANKRILEVFAEREALGLGFFEDLPKEDVPA